MALAEKIVAANEAILQELLAAQAVRAPGRCRGGIGAVSGQSRGSAGAIGLSPDVSRASLLAEMLRIHLKLLDVLTLGQSVEQPEFRAPGSERSDEVINDLNARICLNQDRDLVLAKRLNGLEDRIQAVEQLLHGAASPDEPIEAGPVVPPRRAPASSPGGFASRVAPPSPASNGPSLNDLYSLTGPDDPDGPDDPAAEEEVGPNISNV